jgi:hypothetical protein
VKPLIGLAVIAACSFLLAAAVVWVLNRIADWLLWRARTRGGQSGQRPSGSAQQVPGGRTVRSHWKRECGRFVQCASDDPACCMVTEDWIHPDAPIQPCEVNRP